MNNSTTRYTLVSQKIAQFSTLSHQIYIFFKMKLVGIEILGKKKMINIYFCNLHSFLFQEK